MVNMNLRGGGYKTLNIRSEDHYRLKIAAARLDVTLSDLIHFIAKTHLTANHELMGNNGEEINLGELQVQPSDGASRE